MSSYILKTLGCKANLYDSQIMERELQKRGWTPGGEEDALLCIVNSCTVTDEADRQSRKMASRLARENPRATVVVTGCAAEVDPERLARSKGIHYVVGNRNKPEIVDLILKRVASGGRPSEGEVLGVAESLAEMTSRHPMDREWPEVGDAGEGLAHDGHASRTRAFLKIQDGCNSFCTYCIIPYGRGPSRSLRPIEVIERVRKLVAQGTREIVLTGINLGDYGVDWSGKLELAELVRMILGETELKRLRVSSLDPTEITDDLLAVMRENSRFCPHFHVSLQSAHDRVLRLMKRRYGFAQIRECLLKIAEIPAPAGGPFVGMDVITGFPGEGETEFEATYEALVGLPWSRLHVFPYSERAGTPATRLPNVVPMEERTRRARRLGELSLARLTEHYRRAMGSEHEVLLERPYAQGAEKWISGYSANYLRFMMRFHEGVGENDLVTTTAGELKINASAGEVQFVSD